MPNSSILRRPLYRQVMAAMREWVHEKQPGDRLGTESEFVRQFGVSLVTVRQALRELETEGIIERRQGSGTFVSQIPIAQRHVGILLDADPTSPLLSPFLPKVIQEIRRTFKDQGTASRTYYGFATPSFNHDGPLSCEDVLDDARLNRLTGLIAFYTTRHESWTGILRNKNIPLLDTQYRWEKGWFSKTSFIKSALEHFQQQGRRRLAVLAWENPDLLSKPFRDELRALAPRYGIEVGEHLVDITASAFEVGMGWERFRDLWRKNSRKPDSLMILDDMLFADCQKAILELGISVPESLHVLVKTSDAMNLAPRFPIYVRRGSTSAAAEKFAQTMSAMINGAEPPDWNIECPAIELMEPQEHFPTPSFIFSR